MAIDIVSKKKVFENFREGEPISGVVAGLRLVKDVAVVWKGKSKVVDKIQVKILTNELDSKGERMTALFSATASSHEKGNLRKFVKQVTGKDPGDKFDVEKLLQGRQADFVFESNTSKDGRVFSNIVGVLKSSEKVTIPDGFEAFYSEPDEATTVRPEDQEPEEGETVEEV